MFTTSMLTVSIIYTKTVWFKFSHSIDRKKNVIHRYITDNETEEKTNNYKELIEELPDETSPTMIDDCVNKNLDDRNRKKYVW